MGAYFSCEHPDIIWHLFDLTIVTLGAADTIHSLFSGAAPNGGVATVFRVVRLLRILRIFRIVRFLKQLYMLAYGFALAAEAVFWVAILMFFMLYTRAIVPVRSVGRLSEESPHHE